MINQDNTVAQYIPGRAPTLLDVIGEELQRLDNIVCSKEEYYASKGVTGEAKERAQQQREKLQEAPVKALLAGIDEALMFPKGEMK